MTYSVLTRRQLNRATLARQMLLERSGMGIVEAVDWLVGLQGQVSDAPYLGLWSRLENFRHEALTALIVERVLVRATSLRATLHLHSVDDLLGLRPLVQPVLDRMWQSAFGNRRFGDNDIAAVHRAGVKLLDRGPLTGAQLGAALQEKFPAGEALAKAVLVQIKEVLIQIPPTRIWGSGHAPILTRAENWVPPPHRRRVDARALVRRYLAAYGPASIADMQAWSGLTRLGDVFTAIADELDRFESKDGTALYDVRGGMRPDEEMNVPVRFLPDFDNALLGYADRRRIGDEEVLKQLAATRSFRAVLVDGLVAAHWTLNTRKRDAVLTITPYRKLKKSERIETEREGLALAEFMRPGLPAQIVFSPPPG